MPRRPHYQRAPHPIGAVAASLVCALAVACLLGCGKGPSYDMSSPEATVASFEKAINDGDIPGNLSRLVVDEVEIKQWQLRCKTRGCKKARFKVVATRERTEYTAVLDVDFLVEGDLEGKVLEGNAEPITFERDGKRWFIARIGRQQEVPLNRPTGVKVKQLPADAAVPLDAGAAADAGADAG